MWGVQIKRPAPLALTLRTFWSAVPMPLHWTPSGGLGRRAASSNLSLLDRTEGESDAVMVSLAMLSDVAILVMQG